MKIGLIQLTCSPDLRANRKKAAECVRDAASKGAEIICLPELFLTPYFCQSEDHCYFELAEPVPGPTTGEMAALAAELGVVLIVPIFERRAPGGFHNTAAIIDSDGSYLGKYRKMHIPDDPLYYEKFYFAPGDLGFKTWDTRKGRIGVLICWDQWYPEAARLTALSGAGILFYPTAIGWHPAEKAEFGRDQHAAWQTIQQGHAIANGIFVAAANRTGHEGAAGGGIEFWGASFVAAPDGSIIQKASHDTEEILVVDCDPAKVEVARTHWPFLRDRRIDAYGSITQRYLD
jgi:N-carbamoylputrescine amidase